MRNFLRAAFLLPGRVVSGLFGSVFGSTDKNDDEVKNPGLLGYVLNFVKAVGVAITDFIAAHEKTISIAFWSSLALAGAAALTVAFLPAALTAVTTFAINGYSIAGLVGTEFAAQVGAVAAVTAFAASTAVYTVAGVANTINNIIGLFPGKTPAASGSDALDGQNLETSASSHSRMSAIGGKRNSETASLLDTAAAPTNFGSIAKAPTKPTPAAAEPATATAAPK